MSHRCGLWLLVIGDNVVVSVDTEDDNVLRKAALIVVDRVLCCPRSETAEWIVDFGDSDNGACKKKT